MANKYTDEELAASVNTPGWSLRDQKTEAPITGTLEEVLKTAHERQVGGEHPGLIERIETSVELDMLQVEMLWRYLGLPL